ncbi:MAG: hypothetical protein LKCHEGNO_03193 [Burkholderiaceae bacterium]|jgi:alkylhydroperoxidase family enzyme|uniref:carboxymuconolactone decarboxylase family protein n=1 Tax=Bradyrhizobium sp. TaxID=376 RepID=UPI003D120191|nr:hypothetical protein [Burkholderiaceae bacterium]
MSQLPFVSEDCDDPRVRDVFDRMRKRWPGAPVLHLYRVLAWAPGLLTPWADFASALRFKTVTPAALRELMIVRAGQLMDCEYEWKHHWPAALEAGVPEQKLQALSEWKVSELYDPQERAVLSLADDTARGVGASPQTMDALKAALPNEQVAELVIIAGFYAAVGRIVNSFDIELEPGYESLTPRDESA